MNIQDLRDRYKGKTCYVIGKGPSLDYLKEGHIDKNNPVIALNESIIKIERFNLDFDNVFSLQQDGDPDCMRRPEKSYLILSQVSKQYYPDYERRIIFDRVKDLGIPATKYTVISAIEIARLMGCNNIIFVSFDACYNGNINYPKKIGCLKKCSSHYWRLLIHCAGIKMQLKGLSAEWLNPKHNRSKKVESAPYTIITPTGDRRQMFNLCFKYVLRQSVLPFQWIVVDDGVESVMQPMIKEFLCPVSLGDIGIDYIRRVPEETDPNHTLKKNILAALPHVKYDKIIIFEDDDWYHKDYAKYMLEGLNKYDLFGLAYTIYYHFFGATWVVNPNDLHASFCQMAFSTKLLSIVEECCKKDDSMFLDVQIWENFKGNKYVEKDLPCISLGMKGMLGRKGQSSGHDIRIYKAGKKDKNYVYLKSKIGLEDFEEYRKFIPSIKDKFIRKIKIIFKYIKSFF